ncbi:MAG: MAPEG family protein [Pseudomonadota bacterium]
MHEQPTLFYAVSVILAVAGAGALDVTLAWIYVALRIVHSLWQILINKLPVRFLLFLASTIVLITLAVRAVMATAFADPSLAPQ